MRVKNFGVWIMVLIGAVSLSVGCGGKKESPIGLEENNQGIKLSGKVIPEEGSKVMVVGDGSKVRVQYIGKFKDGEIFDESDENTPLEFVVGQGAVIEGFEKSVVGMRLNEEKEVIIAAENAYGQRNESLIRQFPKDSFPEDFVPQKGMIVGLGDPSGKSIPATIVDVADDSVTMDLNHPLAGKDLVFDIKVVGIEE